MKRVLVISSILVLLLFCGWRFGFALAKNAERGISQYRLSDSDKEHIIREFPADYKGIIKQSLKLTAKQLTFAEKNNLGENEANCVGYAQVCSCICNYALVHHGYTPSAKPVVGYVSFCGINLYPILQKVVPKKYKNFVKDHDFVELKYNDKVVYFDASLYDYGIHCTTTITSQSNHK